MISETLIKPALNILLTKQLLPSVVLFYNAKSVEKLYMSLYESVVSLICNFTDIIFGGLVFISFVCRCVHFSAVK